MRITLLAAGTLDDVQPFLALALGLRELGHSVVLAASERLRDELEPFHVNYYALTDDARTMPEAEQGRRWIAAGNSRQFMKKLSGTEQDRRHDRQRDMIGACRYCDAIIAHPQFLFEAGVLSERLLKPLMFAFPFPFMPAISQFPHMFVRVKRLPFGFLNRLTYRLFAGAHERTRAADINEWRSALGLEPLRGSYYTNLEAQRVPVLHAYSPELVPFPAHWGRHHYMAGAIKLYKKYRPAGDDQQWREKLERWLDAGSAPIYYGFAGLPAPDPRQMVEIVMHLNDRLGGRAIIDADWPAAALEGIARPDSVFMVKSVDLSWLFPRCRCLVHPGSAGTTHAALEAGVPSVICPAGADQAFWGQRLTALNVGRCVPFAELTPDNLARAIEALQSGEIRANAAEIGGRMKAENGLLSALIWVMNHLSAAPIYRNGL